MEAANCCLQINGGMILPAYVRVCVCAGDGRQDEGVRYTEKVRELIYQACS